MQGSEVRVQRSIEEKNREIRSRETRRETRKHGVKGTRKQ